ncbi:Uncharacterised protein [Mycobacteroides abscessus subsp. abscessus]|nr:Uncharacterised protein [Mycobacteroides abscessus subsp. abscessus]
MVNPRSARCLTGKSRARLSLLATDTKTAPWVGSEPYAAVCDLANARPKSASIPMTSPVDFISGLSSASTPVPSKRRKRLNGNTASLTAMGASIGAVPPSPVAGSSCCSRSSAMVSPSMTRAHAFASGTDVAFDTNGTVRLARGFASRTYRMSSLSAYWTFISPRTPIPLANASVERRTISRSDRPSVIGGSAHAESPEWIPASSMCSMTPPMYTSVPSHSASTSISTASSRKRSTSTGWSGVNSVAREM